ncbi:MAG: FUSC family protein [Aphanocapsa lilacina HA4352-LM1]|jgi:uncharacterized membrane protein YccC|nr:FUSC family protein [Aphanocapsa lilacina HA4352-LM1]
MLGLTPTWRKRLLLDRLRSETAATLKIAVKSGAAALITDLGARLIGLADPTWAVVSAVIVMQANLGSSFGASQQRLVGTAVGAFLGALIGSLVVFNSLVLGAGITLAILVCAALRVYESFRIATVTLAVVLLAGSASPWLFGLERFIDVTLGILVALGVTVTLWPPRSRSELRLVLAEVLAQDERLYAALVENHRQGNGALEAIGEARAAVKRLLIQAQLLTADIGREPPSSQDPLLASLVILIERLQEDLLSMECRGAAAGAEGLHRHLEAEIQGLVEATMGALAALGARLREPRRVVRVPELNGMACAVGEGFDRLRAAQVTRNYGLDEILRFTTFLAGLQKVAAELDALAGEIGKLAAGS